MRLRKITMQQHVFTIADICRRAGVSNAIICPGSRSAPLVYAFTQSGIECTSVVDERSAAYMALGMAQQLQKPVVLLCTSGTATLNFYPAIAEAFYQHIPLLVLTADRPPELLNQQDGQMIVQKNVYGKHVLLSTELPCYHENKEDLVACEETMTIALKMSQGANGTKGPVHINIPLREPLYPKTMAHQKVNTKSLDVSAAEKQLTTHELFEIEKAWKNSSRKLILVGQYPLSGALNGALLELAKHPDVVIVADVLSNVFEFNTASCFDYFLLRSDQSSKQLITPDFIISLGGPVLSKSLKLWLQSVKPTYHFRINETPHPIDTYQNVTHHLYAKADLAMKHVSRFTKGKTDLGKQYWQTANLILKKTIQRYLAQNQWSELDAMHRVLQLLPNASNLQVGNSSIIRYISYLGLYNASWRMNGNRGTSGIDGCTSTAVGAAMANNIPTYLITGDLAFFYDINALWNTLPDNLKIIVFNNNGGGIFQLLDGPTSNPEVLKYFTTPHQQSIEALAKTKGIKYHVCTSHTKWSNVASFFTPSAQPAILELKFNATQNAKAFQSFKRIKL